MAKNIAASRQKKPSGLSDKVSDIVLVVICAAIKTHNLVIFSNLCSYNNNRQIFRFWFASKFFKYA